MTTENQELPDTGTVMTGQGRPWTVVISTSHDTDDEALEALVGLLDGVVHTRRPRGNVSIVARTSPLTEDEADSLVDQIEELRLPNQAYDPIDFIDYFAEETTAIVPDTTTYSI